MCFKIVSKIIDIYNDLLIFESSDLNSEKLIKSSNYKNAISDQNQNLTLSQATNTDERLNTR